MLNLIIISTIGSITLVLIGWLIGVVIWENLAILYLLFFMLSMVLFTVAKVVFIVVNKVLKWIRKKE